MFQDDAIEQIVKRAKNVKEAFFQFHPSMRIVELFPECLEHLPYMEVTDRMPPYSGKFRRLKSLMLDSGVAMEEFNGGNENENDGQLIANILLANQEHLELLCLLLDRNETSLRFLPPNLKYLHVRLRGAHRYDSLGNTASRTIEMAVEQCPKLCGVEFFGFLGNRIIDSISRFEKFVFFN